MFKRLLTVLLFALVFIIMPAKALPDRKERVLIVYDRQNYYGYSSNLLSSVTQLLGAFNTSVSSYQVDEYKSGTLQAYDKVIVLGIEGNIKSEVFLGDLESFQDTILWAGYGIENYRKDLFPVKEYTLGAIYLYYTNERGENPSLKDMKKFSIQPGQGFPLINNLPKEAKVYGYIDNGYKEYPLVVQYKNLWYLSRVDDSSILFYVFSDLLRDFTGEADKGKSRILMRVEDVHPFRNPEKLKRIADYLYGEGIPYGISLIPTYVNPETGYITRMSEVPGFIEAIKYMQDRGGAVILHGYTHQEEDGDVTGEGYEFWDGKNDIPLKVDMERYVYERVYNGVTECLKNGIYPLAFEAPHYAMDESGYREIKKYFSTYVGQFQSSNNRFTTTAFPYIIEGTELFNRLIPENLGYIDPDNPFTLEDIENRYTNLSIVRGHTAGFFVHSFLDIKYLESIIDAFKNRNSDFIDLKKEHNWINISRIRIESRDGKISVSGFSEKGPKEQGRKTSINSINKIFIFVVGSFVLIFSVVFLLSKSINRRKFIR